MVKEAGLEEVTFSCEVRKEARARSAGTPQADHVYQLGLGSNKH